MKVRDEQHLLFGAARQVKIRIFSLKDLHSPNLNHSFSYKIQ